ncbi:segregation and condensation protein A [Spiroplasma taiwanense]|uniref:Segregation and condensation protein A n=1 Tax=Spiroplasma taiwanense CT-1 TaxID=1276220 RepID=S5LTB6_9MOLU|nr:segregation/condensation protein A [Spiroplasma taiwanense]AGR40944.1 segregation and condensation protein A [Spiroplasma taiwanense CT-1]
MQKWNEIQLNNFNGPLDLLLHLIKEKEINIMDINLLELSNQYVNYIREIELLDLEIASEYLVMSAYLIELKSKLLIPKEEVNIDDNYEELERQDLIRRLIEYHKIKEVTNFFKTKQEDYLKGFSKIKTIIRIAKIDDNELPLAENNINIDKFSNIFLKAIEKNKFKKMEINTIKAEEISPEKISEEIKLFLKNNNVSEIDLVKLIELKEFSIKVMVATFLAVLDLAAKKIITVSQNENEVIVKYIG